MDRTVRAIRGIVRGLPPAARAAARALLLTAIAALLLWAGQDYRPTPTDLALAPHRFNLITWEIGNLFDKWYRQLTTQLPWNAPPTRPESIALTEEFFQLSQELVQLQNRLIAPNPASPPDADALRQRQTQIRQRQNDLRPIAEATIESEITAVLKSEGLQSPLGIILPPVDTVFSPSPALLVTSPRDRIHRQDNILLNHGITPTDRESLEQQTLQQRNLSAIVVNTGGIGSYPSVVSPNAGMHYAITTAAHEWLHNWFFFRPLGRNFWRSPEMTTLNETAATLAGWEIGDRAYTALTGIPINRQPPPPPATPSPNAFNFNAEMRQTRQQAERLLAQGQIPQAEAYMESRRQQLLERGYPIRKINQAHFAFYGSYATSPASASPLETQLRTLRQQSPTLAHFLKTISQFATYPQFQKYIEAHTQNPVPQKRHATTSHPYPQRHLHGIISQPGQPNSQPTQNRSQQNAPPQPQRNRQPRRPSPKISSQKPRTPSHQRPAPSIRKSLRRRNPNGESRRPGPRLATPKPPKFQRHPKPSPPIDRQRTATQPARHSQHPTHQPLHTPRTPRPQRHRRRNRKHRRTAKNPPPPNRPTPRRITVHPPPIPQVPIQNPQTPSHRQPASAIGKGRPAASHTAKAAARSQVWQYLRFQRRA